MKKMSEMEMAILDLLWDKNEPMLSRDMLQYFSEKEGKELKKQTLNNFLSKLLDKRLIKRISADRRYLYVPAVSREEYKKRLAENLIDEIYEGSFKNFICALSGGAKITREEANRIKDRLKE